MRECYVQHVKQMAPAFDPPVMFWHGGAMTGVIWETTPDGLPGGSGSLYQQAETSTGDGFIPEGLE